MRNILGKTKQSSRLRLGLEKGSLGHRLTKFKTSQMKRREVGTFVGPAESSPPFAAPGPDGRLASRPQIQIRPHVGFATERAAYARMKADLLREAAGRFVVFVGPEMIGPYDDFRSAHKAGLREFGPGPLYIKQILQQDLTSESGTVETCRS